MQIIEVRRETHTMHIRSVIWYSYNQEEYLNETKYYTTTPAGST